MPNILGLKSEWDLTGTRSFLCQRHIYIEAGRSVDLFEGRIWFGTRVRT
jgi:hypothetical protein